MDCHNPFHWVHYFVLFSGISSDKVRTQVERGYRSFHPDYSKETGKMRRHSIFTTDKVLKWVRFFRYMKRTQLALLFTGSGKRIKAVEQLLPKLEREGKITSTWLEGEKVYSPARKKRVQPVSLEHEIEVTEILILLWLCRKVESEIVSERVFRGFAIVPEGGIRYSEERGTMLVFEYCTRKNFDHGGVMKSKLTRYRKQLAKIEDKVRRTINVLFVIDIDRVAVRKFVTRMQPLLDEPVISGLTGEERYPFFFTDYETFKAVPVGEALIAKIYFWHDGKEWRLTNND